MKIHFRKARVRKLTAILECFFWPLKNELKGRSQALSKPEYRVLRFGSLTGRDRDLSAGRCGGGVERGDYARKQARKVRRMRPKSFKRCLSFKLAIAVSK